MIDGRLPPYDSKAEEAVIGSLLIDGDAILEVTGVLKPEDFFEQQNRLVYEACVSIYENHQEINQITVARELAQRGVLEEVGGAAYLSYLISSVPTSLHIESYASIVSRLSVMRRLITASNKIATIGYEADSEVETALSDAENVLFKVRQQQTSGDFTSLHDMLGKYFQETQAVSTAEVIPHVFTGYTVVDNLLTGLQRSNLIVIGARTSIGKTSLALNIARNAAMQQNACIAMFSLEMSKMEIVQRLLSIESNLSSGKIRRAEYTEEEEVKLMDAVGRLSAAPIYIDDTPQMRVAEMRGKARRLHFEQPIDLIVVDYIQLIKPDSKRENRVQELSEITRSLKALARDINVPVLALSQLRREPDPHIEPRRPQLSDLRDSGSIEQDSDIVIFIHRSVKTDGSDDFFEAYTREKKEEKGITDIIIAKNRNGPLGEGQLQFHSETTRFTNLVDAGRSITS
jgi:replicative DNA helicase